MNAEDWARQHVLDEHQRQLAAAERHEGLVYGSRFERDAALLHHVIGCLRAVVDRGDDTILAATTRGILAGLADIQAAEDGAS